MIESPTNLTIVAPIAGVDLDDIDVALNNGVLTISGVRNKLSALYE
ncbi:MAG: Hsp20/alpha crystallin family protein [Candidatus Peribacteria bacterium]|nr:MAG: Hsp20/alpha crystallin family protein [Candidatus Peribacteria bacterium]